MDLDAYLAASDVIDWGDPAVQDLAVELTAGLTSDVDQARALFEWVRDRTPHSADAGRDEVTCSASQVLEVGTGICYAKSHLLAALLRSIGIPAGFCYQVFENDAGAEGSYQALHGLNGIFFTSLGQWVRVDPRGNRPGVDAQFSVEEERLAFPELEFLDDQVYPEPLPQVVSALRRYRKLSKLWPNLPAPPPVGQSE